MTALPRSSERSESLGSKVSSARIVLGRRLRAESFDTLLLAGTTIFLVGAGVVMVFSSSTVTSYVEAGDFLGSFLKQGLYAFLGIPLMLLISSLPETVFMRFAWLALGIASFLQLLVVATPLGIEVGGNTNWIDLFGIQFQPSEMIKLSLVIWLGMMVTRKEHVLSNLTHGLLPILMGAGIPIGLVLLGGDLGTVLVMVVFVFGALFLIGIPLRLFIVPGVAAVAILLFVAFSSSNRVNRILSYLGGNSSADYMGDGWQIQHSNFALANGGLFGVGLGQSTAKWSWLPAADNDFIFAIIGEELGLIGALVFIALFGLLGYALVRVYVHASTPFGQTASAAVLLWIITQAVMNIAVVLGVVPVLGVPLPLISAGGTALVTSLAAIGIALSVARHSHREGV